PSHVAVEQPAARPTLRRGLAACTASLLLHRRAHGYTRSVPARPPAAARALARPACTPTPAPRERWAAPAPAAGRAHPAQGRPTPTPAPIGHSRRHAYAQAPPPHHLRPAAPARTRGPFPTS